MASIENVLNDFSRYGPSELRSEEFYCGILGQFNMATEIQDGPQNRGTLLVLFYLKKVALFLKMIF